MDLTEYKTNYTEIFNLLKKLSTDQINFKPAINKWSIHEILAHLADTEVQSHVRMRTILANKDPIMVYFDEMDWSIILDYNKVELNESLEVIQLMRKVNYNLLSRLLPEQFQKKGIHSVRGELSLEELIQFYIQHVNEHLRQIRRNLSLMESAV
ncbi:DinB family protein [candidate division KSB1 bacterium]|nr:DinB family protein [candidate division KSB1 bacterium]